jgi:type VI protein secretion system component VasK
MSQNPSFDSSIPVLTEVVVESLPAGQAEAEVAEVAPEAPAAPETTLQALPEPDWDALEARIAERVVAQLQPQIDAVVRNALASAADQIHIGLRQAIEQVVAQQVAAIQFGQK